MDGTMNVNHPQLKIVWFWIQTHSSSEELNNEQLQWLYILLRRIRDYMILQERRTTPMFMTTIYYFDLSNSSYNLEKYIDASECEIYEILNVMYINLFLAYRYIKRWQEGNLLASRKLFMVETQG